MYIFNPYSLSSYLAGVTTEALEAVASSPVYKSFDNLFLKRTSVSQLSFNKWVV